VGSARSIGRSETVRLIVPNQSTGVWSVCDVRECVCVCVGVVAADQLKQSDSPISSPEGYWRITSNGHPGTGSVGDSLISTMSALDRIIAAAIELAARSSGYLVRRERRGASSGD
jgi:hypothetical protein